MRRRLWTRAVLTSLAGGAGLSDSLRIGATVAQSTEDERAAGVLQAASLGAKEEAFRADELERVPFDPPAVGVLLRAAEPAHRGRMAEVVLEALRLRASSGSLVLLLWLLITALGVLALTWRLSSTLGGARVLPIGEGLLAGRLPTILAGVALLLILRELLGLRRRAVLDADALRTDRLMLWLVAGEMSGVPPGAVLAALHRSATRGDRLRLSRLQSKMRGARTAAEALEAWPGRLALGSAPSALRSVFGAATGLGPSEVGTRAISRFAKLVHERRGNFHFARVLAAMLLFSAVGLSAAEVLSRIGYIGTSLPGGPS